MATNAFKELVIYLLFVIVIVIINIVIIITTAITVVSLLIGKKTLKPHIFCHLKKET